MSVVESAYSTLVQGVSQQHPAARAPGQVTAQLNMLSDPVTGLRRRPGAKYVKTLSAPGFIRGSQTRVWVAEIGGADHLVMLVPGVAPEDNPATLLVYDMAYNLVGSFAGVPYLTALDTNDIDIATLRGDLWVLNREKVPGLTLDAASIDRPDPDTCGFFWVKSAAFSKTYTVTVEYTPPGTTAATTYDATYTTPDGTHVNDAELSTPGYIAGQLSASISTSSGITFDEASSVGAFVAFRKAVAGGKLRLYQRTGDTYMGSSGSMNFRLVSDLPSTMATARRYSWTVSVGAASTNRQYYRWDSAAGAWVECAKWGTSGEIYNMPRRLRYNNTGTLVFEAPTFPARMSGDDANNPYPGFITDGTALSGIASYQGRLLLLAGNRACLSDSTNATIFTRSTVTNIIDSDYVEIGSGSLSSATFRYATQYNKDLILWSGAHQAVLPGGSAALTPRSAYLVSTGTAVLSLSVEPAQVGRWLVYSTPSAQNHYGFGGLYPSDYSASQYTLTPLTDHLPTYFTQPARFLCSSGSTGLAVSGTGTTSVWVYQYLWQGSNLVQSAWHRWEFPLPVAGAYFYKDLLYLLLTDVLNNRVFICSLDCRRPDRLTDGGTLNNPYLDLASTATWNGTAWSSAHPATGSAWGGTPTACRSGTYSDAAGEPLALNPDMTLLDGSGCEPGLYWVGVSFESAVTPTPPVVKDQQGRSLDEGSTRVLSYKATLRDSGEFLLRVSDADGARPDQPINPVRWSSSSLQNMRSLVEAHSTVNCPVHVLAMASSVEFYTSSTREFNITGLSYKLRLAQRTRRI